MTPTPLRSADALLEACLNLRVAGDDGVKISACIRPTLRTSTHVSGIVEWHGTKVVSSVVSAQGDESPWGQRFLLVWAAAGAESRGRPVPAVFFGSR